MHIHYRVFAVGQGGLEHSVVPRRDGSVQVELPHVALLVRGAHLVGHEQTADSMMSMCNLINCMRGRFPVGGNIYRSQAAIPRQVLEVNVQKFAITT
jgi:hypothetical protein